MPASAAYLVDALRSPTGRRGGSLANAHPTRQAVHFAARPGMSGTMDVVIFGVTLVERP